MQCENRTLYLFTAQFPFGKVSETFLETEIIFLAQKFKTVCIIPSAIEGEERRELPKNVEIITEFSNNSFSKSEKIKMLFNKLKITVSILYSEILDKGFLRVFKGRKLLLDYLANQLILAKNMEKLVCKNENTIFYDYWFCNATLALSILKFKHPIRIVARGHGFDVYDERWETGVPFRNWKLKQLNKLYIISQYGVLYTKSKITSNLHKKIELSRLGVLKQIKLQNQVKSDVPVIISVARVASFKNIHKIPKLLTSLNRPFKWIHFGDGEDMPLVKKASEKYLKENQYELKGHVSNEELISFLQKNHVDLLLSLSSSEGLPVSMMEVQSFGIPILSTAVGGVPEIVINEKTGFLLNGENEKQLLNKSLDYSFSKDEIISFFDEHFNATRNYSIFVNGLCCLEK